VIFTVRVAIAHRAAHYVKLVIYTAINMLVLIELCVERTCWLSCHLVDIAVYLLLTAK
jgi:hypothetical protein